MAFVPSSSARNLANQIGIEPNLILEIEGIPIIFGSQDISRYWKFDEDFLFDTPNLRFDSPFPDPDSRDYISLKGTSKTIGQQVLPDKKGTSSTLKMNIELVDFNGEVTELFRPGNHVEDIIGQRASTYIGFKAGSHPEDSIPLINGYISDIQPKAGGYIVVISHSENKKRQKLFNVYSSNLAGPIDAVQTIIPVNSTKGLIQTQDALTSYIRIEDEIMEVVSVDSEFQLTVVRSRLNTIAATHDDDEDIASVYGLSGDAITLALKLYLSGGDEFYSTLPATSFVGVNSDLIEDAIFFNDYDLENVINVTEGDIVTITGATVGGNNGTFTITDVVNITNGSYIVCEGAGFSFESPSTASVSFKSQFNTLPIGCSLIPFDVDIAQHLFEYETNFSSLPTYEFYLEDSINAKDFVDNELYFPSGLYSINRKAKISAKYTAAPLAIEETPNLNSDNITNINKIKVRRSTLKFMYNTIDFEYNKSPRTGKILTYFRQIDLDAYARTDKVFHTLTVESTGLRRNADTSILIGRQTNRFLQRYRYGATLYKGVEVLFKDAWTLEIGDVVAFGGEDVLIPSVENGTPYTPKKLVEIINKQQDVSTGKIKFDLLDTAFDVNSRYGVFAPASFITTNSTTTKLELQLSFYTGSVDTERQKWATFIGEKIRVRTDDYSYDEITTITSLAPENQEVLNIEPLPSTPPAGCLIEPPPYDESNSDNNSEYKARYTHNNHQAAITGVTSASAFDVATPERFVVGGQVLVHAPDYTRDQLEPVTIQDITGNTITLEETLSFTPLSGDLVENMTFKDNGVTYRYV